MNLAEYRKALNSKLSDYLYLSKKVKEERKNLAQLRHVLRASLKAQDFLQRIAKFIQDKAHKRIARIVTQSLRAVFNEPYTFEIHFERKRGKTDARLVFKRGDLILEDPSDEAGGGVIDVAAFALRLACILLAQPQRRKVIILDEPWKFLSEEYQPAMRELVLSLAEEMKVQFVLVTHNKEFCMGKIIDLS